LITPHIQLPHHHHSPLQQNTLHTSSFFFFITDTPTSEIYTLSLHDALPISASRSRASRCILFCSGANSSAAAVAARTGSKLFGRSEEHTSELQSRGHLVCRLLLEKKKNHTGTSRHIRRNVRVRASAPCASGW